ncbi:hypothetical protein [Nocardia testacea]|uniref:hypothetical protein n=1 Tax=Nocardia testacea TaxID=248551 RepID=UPI0033E35F39
MSQLAERAADRAALEAQTAGDMAAWARAVAEVLANAGHTPAAAERFRGCDADARLFWSLDELAERGGRIRIDVLRADLPPLLRPLLGGAAGTPAAVTDPLTAALELIAAAYTRTVAADTVPGARLTEFLGHLDFAGSILRQAVALLDPAAATIARGRGRGRELAHEAAARLLTASKDHAA